MATQLEINYENALVSQDEAREAYTDANNLYLANKQFVIDSKIENDKYGDCVIAGINFLHNKSITDCTYLKGAIKSGFEQATFNLIFANGTEYKNAKEARKNYADAVSKETSLREAADEAKVEYQQSRVNASNAYDDWMEWKISNMTAEELEEYQDLEQSGKLFGLKMDVWKWVAIGVGSLLFIFAAWWILRKFKVKIPKIIIPDKIIGSAI